MNNLDNDSVEIATAASLAAQEPSTRLAPFVQLLKTKQPSAEVLARALAYSAVHYPGIYNQQIQAILGSQLQVLLTKEHVAAQEKMSYSAAFLAAAGVFLAGVTLFASCTGMT